MKHPKPSDKGWPLVRFGYEGDLVDLSRVECVTEEMRHPDGYKNYRSYSLNILHMQSGARVGVTEMVCPKAVIERLIVEARTPRVA